MTIERRSIVWASEIHNFELTELLERRMFLVCGVYAEISDLHTPFQSNVLQNYARNGV